ncbi:4-coumarate--CoA ligase 5 [Hyalella azteca]|uniref:Luciferin 4-monooxygenase n=1 Tax=Hyalella azteca TaxID=294128 RepID=A0A8B7PKB0_HYAAZ|nr:4-coumarate--CoA ligase 5 [Hyalella azteca]
MLSKFAREIARSCGPAVRITQRVESKLWVRKYCIPASASKANEEVVFRSPYTDVDIPNVSLIKYLRDKTKLHDDRIALVCGENGEELRYGEMWRRVDNVASALARLGVQRNTTVALVAPNCPELVVSFFATISTGAVATTVNCLATPAEMARQLENSDTAVVVFHPAMAGVVQQAVGRLQQQKQGSVRALICTHALPEKQPGLLYLPDLYGDDGSALPSTASIIPSEDLVVLPYSSGTTGLPKGVMLTHSNIIANLQQLTHHEVMDVNPDGDVLFGVLPMFHIYGMVACLFMSVSMSCKVVTFTKFDPQLYVQSLVKYQPTILHTVPPILGFLAQTPEVRPEFLQTVRLLVCGAAPVGEALARCITHKFGSLFKFQEGYGMTEMSPVSHVSAKAGYVPGSCGVPVPNTAAKIVHVKTGVALAAGEGEGELLIKGPQVMKGYLKNEVATAETIDSDGWLHTGDVAKVDSDGNFYIVDRLKELIKVKGFQVAPAELEDLLRGFVGVADVAVVGVPDDKLGERPRAYVVKHPNNSVTEAALEQFVASKVSVHKRLTGGVVFVDAIPKNSTGKIMRKELREMAAKEASAAA